MFPPEEKQAYTDRVPVCKHDGFKIVEFSVFNNNKQQAVPIMSEILQEAHAVLCRTPRFFATLHA